VVTQEHDFFQGGRQLADCLPDNFGGRFIFPRRVFRRGVPGRKRRRSLSHHIDGHVPADAGQPGGEFARLFQPLQIHQPLGERLLDGVLGQLVVSEHAVGYGNQREVVMLTQLAEAVEIARPGGFDQFFFCVYDLFS
jgi:hypothetical protein